MQGLNRIVVGIDVDRKTGQITPGSHKAVVQASWLSRECSAPLVLLGSFHADDVSDPRGKGAQPSTNADLVRGQLAALEETLGSDGIDCETIATPVKAWIAITRVVLAEKADMVIVAKRTLETTDGRRLGSVAVKLLRKCPCPVWVVKPGHDLEHRLILAATDLTPVGGRAVRSAAFLASKKGAELHVVHAYRTPLQLQMAASSMTEEEYEAELEQIKSEARANIERVLEGFDLEHKPKLHLPRASAAQGIRKAVERLDPDLLVMGMISRGGLPGILVGDTAERLLGRLDCSLLTVKPEDFITPVEPGEV